MSDPRLALTRYRVAQHWRFHSVTPEAAAVLCVTGVELHPTRGVVITAWVDYEPLLLLTPSWHIGGVHLDVTQDAMDRSVADLVAEKGLLPRLLRRKGEFQRSDDEWEKYPQDIRTETVGEIVEETTARYRRQRDAGVPPAPDRPPPESLGLWSLIDQEEHGRLRELFAQHPSLVTDPLPDDETDDACYAAGDDEFRDCPPLSLAAYRGNEALVRMLLELGADPRAANHSGETALHFAGRTHSHSGMAAAVRVLCEAGADPAATDAAGRTPMTCGYCPDEIAAVLHEFGAPLTLNHALRLREFDEARRILRENPRAVHETPMPREVFDDVVHFVRAEAQRRRGREVRLAGGGPAFGDDAPDDLFCTTWSYTFAPPGISDDPQEKVLEWRRHAEIEREVFEECRDLLEATAAQGATARGSNALWYAAQMLDMTFAEWLVAHGATAADLPHLTTEHACTRRMRDLLRRLGVPDETYASKKEGYEIDRDEFEAQLRDLFDNQLPGSPYTAAITSAPFCPPNPKLVDRPYFTRPSRAVFGM